MAKSIAQTHEINGQQLSHSDMVQAFSDVNSGGLNLVLKLVKLLTYRVGHNN